MAPPGVQGKSGRRKYLSADERRRFLQMADTLDPALRALCYVLAITGCRITEALNLTRYQLDEARGTLTVKTLKRRRVTFRIVPIPGELVAMLIELPLCAEGDRFWVIHRSTAWRCVKHVMLAGGISGPMACCKGLRHGFGIRAASCNIPLNLIQRWMGHASLSTTAVYMDAVGVEETEFVKRMWK